MANTPIEEIQKSYDFNSLLGLGKNRVLQIMDDEIQSSVKGLDQAIGSGATEPGDEGGGFQYITKCLIKLKDGTGTEKYSYKPGQQIHLHPEIEYLRPEENYPERLPMIFVCYITVPGNQSIDNAPTPTDTFPIVVGAPYGNGNRWPENYNFNQSKATFLLPDQFGTQVFPFTFTEAFPLGVYTVEFQAWWFDPDIYDPENPATYPAMISFDQKTFRFSLDISPTYSISDFRTPNFYDHERLEALDLNRMAKTPRHALGLIQSVIFDGQSGYISGLDLRIDQDASGRFVEVGPGKGTIFGDLDGNIGNHLIVTGKATKVGYFTNTAPPSGDAVRWDIIEVGLETIDEGETDGSVGDVRVFLDPKSLDGTTGRPKRYTRVVPTVNKMVMKVLWTVGIVGSGETESAEYAYTKTATDGYFKLGYVRSSTNTDLQSLLMNPDNPVLTMKTHREKTPLDHADESILVQHIDPSIIGDFSTANNSTDLDLKSISDEIWAARGNTTGINERMSAVISEDGTIIREPVKDLVEEVLTDLFSNMIDSKGNLREGAMNQAGLLTRGAAVMGVVPDGGFVQLPFGYSQSQCAWMGAFADVAFSPGAQTLQAKWIKLFCTVNGRQITTRSVVKYDAGGTETESTYHGSANFLCIGFKTTP